MLDNVLVHYSGDAGAVLDKGEDEDFFCIVVFVDYDAE